MLKKLVLTMGALVLALTLAACGSQPGEQGQGGGVDTAAGFPVTVTDAGGTEVTVAAAPQRLISLTPSNTEILFALGLADRVVGVGDYDDYPPEVKEKPKIGGMELNEEKVLELQPDLVVATQSMNGAQISRLRELGLTVVAVEAQTVADTYRVIKLLGQVTGTTDQAAALVTEMEQGFADLAAKVATIPQEERKRVFLEVGFQPLYAAGPGSLQHELLTLAGGVNVVREQSPWLQYSDEQVVADNPDAVVLLDQLGGTTAASVKQRPGWDQIKAVKNNMIAGSIDENTLVRPTPRILQGTRELAAFLYPDVFANQ